MRSDSKLLTHVDTELELNMIKGLFDDHDITILVEKEGTGAYLAVHSGFNYQGSNVYVAKDDYEKSLELLGALEDIKPSDELDNEPWEQGYVEENVNKRRHFAVIAIIVPVIIFLLVVMGSIIANSL